MSTLRKIFDNIIQHPNDDKYRQIKLANKTFISKVWRYPACEELMKMSGWVVEDDHVRLRDDSHVHIVSQLLESLDGKKSFITKYPLDEYEVLISAVLNSKTTVIQNLLKPCNISSAGMIYCEDGSSTNLLHSAILSQKIDVVELLVKEYSASPYDYDDSGGLCIVSVFGKAPQLFIIRFLRICGVKASFNAGSTSFNLLEIAVSVYCFKVVRFLVEECRVDVNLYNNDLNTSLHYAYMAGHIDIAEYLIQHGADVMAVNSEGHTPHEYYDGIPWAIDYSKTVQSSRIIHNVPGSPEYLNYIKLCNIGIGPEEAVTLTMQQFPSLTEDGPTQPHHDVDHTSFSKESPEYITKRSPNDQPWGSLKPEQAGLLHLTY